MSAAVRATDGISNGLNSYLIYNLWFEQGGSSNQSSGSLAAGTLNRSAGQVQYNILTNDER